MRRSDPHRPVEREEPALHVEALIARLLLWGGCLSIALVLLGLALYAHHGEFRGQVLQLHRSAPQAGQTPAVHVFRSLGEVLHGLATRPVDPLAVTTLGLVLLLVTPVIGVAAAIPAFVAAGDYRYTAVSSIVLAALVLSALLAGGAG